MTALPHGFDGSAESTIPAKGRTTDADRAVIVVRADGRGMTPDDEAGRSEEIHVVG